MTASRPHRAAARSACRALLLPVVASACASPDALTAPTVASEPPVRAVVPGAMTRGDTAPGDTAPGDTPDRTARPSHPPVEGLRRRLERAADGLLYTSESDHPFVWTHLPASAPAPLTEPAFRAAVGLPPDAIVEVRSLDEFFARHIERVDPADPVASALVPRYVTLRETLRRAVPDVRVYRVGAVVVDCWIVGTDGHGRVVGLRTVAIET